MKTKCYLLGIAFTALIFSYDAHADVVTASETTMPTTTSAITIIKDQYTLSMLTPSVFSTLTPDKQKSVAEQWHLTVDDYARYLWLMTNTPNAFYYKDRNLDPSWVLGFNAKDEQERQKFVVIAIQNERERLEKELAFQRDFTQLQQQLFPNQKPVNWSNNGAMKAKPIIITSKK